jgi:hypothetical protein
MINRKDIKEGQIVYFLDTANSYQHEPIIMYGVVDFYSCTDVAVDWLTLAERRIVVDLNGKRTPFKLFKNDSDYRKLPKGWTYNTELYKIEYEKVNTKICYESIDKQIERAYNEGILVKKEITDYETIDAQVDNNGYKLLRKIPQHTVCRCGGTYRYDELYSTYYEAKEALDIYKAEMQRIANLSDRDWVLESVDKVLKRHKAIYNLSESFYENIWDFFKNRCEDIENVDIRIFGGIIQWKYTKNKKWRSL